VTCRRNRSSKKSIFGTTTMGAAGGNAVAARPRGFLVPRTEKSDGLPTGTDCPPDYWSGEKKKEAFERADVRNSGRTLLFAEATATRAQCTNAGSRSDERGHSRIVLPQLEMP